LTASVSTDTIGGMKLKAIAVVVLLSWASVATAGLEVGQPYDEDEINAEGESPLFRDQDECDPGGAPCDTGADCCSLSCIEEKIGFVCAPQS